MYNFSGIICKIWTCDGLIMIGSIITIILHKPWVDGWGQKNVKYCLFTFAFGLLLMGYHISIILNPEIQKYTGEYVKAYSGRDVFYNYHFKNEEENMAFYLDLSSMKKIHPEELKKGNEYVIYYEKDTQIIVRIEDE